MVWKIVLTVAIVGFFLFILFKLIKNRDRIAYEWSTSEGIFEKIKSLFDCCTE